MGNGCSYWPWWLWWGEFHFTHWSISNKGLDELLCLVDSPVDWIKGAILTCAVLNAGWDCAGTSWARACLWPCTRTCASCPDGLAQIFTHCIVGTGLSKLHSPGMEAWMQFKGAPLGWSFALQQDCCKDYFDDSLVFSTFWSSRVKLISCSRLKLASMVPADGRNWGH